MNCKDYDEPKYTNGFQGAFWNKCDVCGRFIKYEDFHNGKAVRYMKTPDSDLSFEKYETLCPVHFHHH